MVPIAWAIGAELGAMCIIEISGRNACDRNTSLRFTPEVSFDNPPTPSWVTDAETRLFEQTIGEAQAGRLHPFDSEIWRNYTSPDSWQDILYAWLPTEACDGENNTKMWNDRGCGSINNGGWMTGLGMLGFHPLGTENGTWLTQILGEVLNPGDLREAVCAGTGLYINLTKINDSRPLDSRFQAFNEDPAYADALGIDLGPFVGSYRTDGDLIAHGIDLNCTIYGWDRGGICDIQQGDPFCKPRVTHYDCPATNSGHLSFENCSLSYMPPRSGAQAVQQQLGLCILAAFMSFLLSLLYVR
ncbi:hypothetical protein GQ53DRAFT_826572 [Thozetella sp. PMI_491]|nr:hypothetical protein GQ53DRAFT_826572 [Thozetella sp. PMI_491]